MKFYLLISLVLLYSLMLNPCNCHNSKRFNISQSKNDDNQWKKATATWYGHPHGVGTDGGACGYSVENGPHNKILTTAGGPSLYLNGRGCGACYKVKCTKHSACSEKSVKVMIRDECAGCFQSAFHFDLCGAAFTAISKPGQGDNLRNVGVIDIQHKRVACSTGKSITFTMDKGANPYFVAFEILNENGGGDIVQVDLKEGTPRSKWLPMKRFWGARWSLSNNGLELKAPFSIRIKSGKGSSNTIKAIDVIPQNWQPGQVYKSKPLSPPLKKKYHQSW